MKKALIIILALCAAVSAQTKRQTIAVLPSVGDLDQTRLELLTDKVREIATKTLPISGFILLKQDVIIKRIGEEELFRMCKEGVCIGELARKADANYGARADVVMLDSSLVLKFELYSVIEDAIFETFTIYHVKDFYEMLDLLEARLPDAFKKILDASKKPESASGIGNVVISGRNYTAYVNTAPQGASLSFNGIHINSCGKTPCSIELPEGNVRILATLAQHETVDTTIAINQNNQRVNMQLKPIIGVLEIKPAYSENIGINKGWGVSINGKAYYSYENALFPGDYTVKLSHDCYEELSFKVSLVKDRREVFDLSQHLRLKTGDLVLSAEKGGVPLSEPVFVNGKQVGETPFNGEVPVCSEITIGNDRKKVNVRIAHNQTVQHKHIFPSETLTADKTPPDGRDKIQEQQALERAREQQRRIAGQTQKDARKNKAAFGTAIGLDIAGAGMVVYGLIENASAEKNR